MRAHHSLPFSQAYLATILRCVQSGIDDITSDDSWALYLDKLNEAIWPGGNLSDNVKKPKTEIEKSQTRKDAASALMDAFPGIPYCVRRLGECILFVSFRNQVL